MAIHEGITWQQAIETIESCNRDLNFYSWGMGVGFGIMVASCGLIEFDAILALMVAGFGTAVLAVYWWAHWKIVKLKREYKAGLFK